MPALDPRTGLKECSRCGVAQPPSEYYAQAACPDGLGSWCKSCYKETNRVRQQGAYRDQANLKASEYRKRNPGARTALSHIARARKLGNGGTHTDAEWERVKEDQGYICLGCGLAEPYIVLTRDHIIPVSKGGTNDISNIQGLCGPCNSRKGARRTRRKVLQYWPPKGCTKPSERDIMYSYE
jgi:5-methylcytosine-specific restriction endonuclease McrA